MVFIIRDQKEGRIDHHMQFFFTKGGGVYTMIHAPYDDENYPFHLVSLVNHEIVQSYDDLPTMEQIKEEIGDFQQFHTDKVVVEGKKNRRKSK